MNAPIAIMVYSMQIVKLGESCLNKFSLDIYMPTVVGLMSFNTMLCLFLALSSGKGVIWDENPKSRKFVSPLFHLCLVLGIAEMILVTYGTKQISGALNRFTLYSAVLRFLARKMQSFRLLFGTQNCNQRHLYGLDHNSKQQNTK